MKTNKKHINKFELFQSVILVNDLYQSQHLYKGSVGTILEIYDEHNYEVEFCNDDGTTLFLDAFNESEIKAI